MKQIFDKIRNVDINDNEAIKEALSSFFQNLPNHVKGACSQWLQTLESVINRFPKYCMPHRNTIETYLTNFLDSQDYYHVIAAAKCGHVLQQVRSSHEKTATPKTSWREHMELLCNAAHSILKTKFSNSLIHENGIMHQKDNKAVYTTPLPMALLAIANVNNQRNNGVQDDEDRSAILSIRLRNIFISVQAMLIEIYPVAKPIRPQTILDVILNTIAETCCSIRSENNIEDMIRIQYEALRTVDALVLCLGADLVPFSPLVIRLFMKTLNWISLYSTEESRKVRCKVYDSLSNWLTTLRCHMPEGGRRDKSVSWVDELVQRFIQDTTASANVVTLNMSKQPSKKLSKKAKRKLANTMLQESSIASHMPGEKNKPNNVAENDDVAIAALACIETLLNVCGIFLKPNIYKIIQNHIVRSCYELESQAEERTLALLRTLEATRKCPPPGLPPPTQYCLELYSLLINSRYNEISKFSSLALMNIRLHLHCSPPSLNFFIEAESSEKEKSTNKVKEIDLTVLEAVAGQDSMSPSPKVTNDINLLDEPVPKKQKLNKVQDQISVSSQSSIEISDDSDNDEGSVEEIEIVNEEKAVEVSETEASEKLPDSTVQEENDVAEPIDIVSAKAVTVYEAPTQLVNMSGDTIDGQESPRSVEVSYDFPSTGKTKVTLLEKMDDENLPSTNDTDDVQITCGQTLRSSQDVNSQKKTEEMDGKEETKCNGVTDTSEEVFVNGNAGEESNVENIVTVKTLSADETVNVEDMLADFVDEVNEDASNV